MTGADARTFAITLLCSRVIRRRAAASQRNHLVSRHGGWRRSSDFFFFNDTAPTEIYPLSLHDALPIYGLEVLAEIRELSPEIRPEVVIVSGHGTIEAAVKATKLGAYDFLEKPLSIERTLI